jgi:hypothetical protein
MFTMSIGWLPGSCYLYYWPTALLVVKVVLFASLFDGASDMEAVSPYSMLCRSKFLEIKYDCRSFNQCTVDQPIVGIKHCCLDIYKINILLDLEFVQQYSFTSLKIFHIYLKVS